MTNVRFSRKARRDLSAIHDFIAQDNVVAAAETLENVYRICVLISENPKLGRLRADVGIDLRYFPVSNLNIFYTEKDNQIIIVRVVHGRREVRRVLNY